MPTSNVRADYASLQQAASRFASQAQAARQTIQGLQQQIDALQGGDWVGQGATSFYREMSNSVMPTLTRLAGALEAAQHATEQISQIMQQAEADAARVLRGDGGAANQSGETSGNGPDSAAGAGRSAGGPAAAGPAFIPNIGGMPNLRAMAQARARRRAAAENEAVDKELSIFDPQVRALAKQSPTLRAQMVTLQKNGFKFVTGPLQGGFKTVPPIITIGQPMNAADTLGEIAHETGHAMRAGHEVTRVVETPSMTRDQYVELNTANNLRNEGAAQFNAVQVRAELKAAGAGDIGVPGEQDAAFEQVYANYAAGRLTQDQALDQMGPLMGNEQRSGDTRTYRDYDIDFYQKDWDKYIAPARAH